MLRRIFLSLLLLALASCGAAKTLKPAAAGSTPKVLVLLPISAPADMAREKGDYVQQALFSELKNAGFYVLEPELSEKECGGEDCPERERLAVNFGAQAFLRLNLESVSRNNFLAGYYNSVSGSLNVSGIDKKELFSFKHSESEKGGLLFNTGQIFQGLKTQFENSKAKSFEILADKFVKGLVARIPEPEKEQIPESNLSIVKTSLRQLRRGVYNICAEATSGALAYLILAKEKPNLREVSPGLYCVNLALGPSELQDRSPQIELRSALGSVVRRELQELKLAPLCDLDGIVQVASADPATKVFFQCAGEGSKCGEMLQRCMGNRYIVYRSPNRLGPYTKVATFEAKEWVDRAPASKDSAYVLVATNSEGYRSRPVSAEKVEAGKS